MVSPAYIHGKNLPMDFRQIATTASLVLLHGKNLPTDLQQIAMTAGSLYPYVLF